MTDLHLGLAGVGRIGAMHARTLVATPGVGRVTVADVDAARAREVGAQVGADAAADVAALLTSGIDGLVVATGTAQHPELIRAGVEAGIPVLCEKPVAPDVALSLPVLDLIARHDGVVRIAHQRRYDPGTARPSAPTPPRSSAGCTPSGP